MRSLPCIAPAIPTRPTRWMWVAPDDVAFNFREIAIDSGRGL